MLNRLIAREPAPLIGLDISSSSVKLVELGRDRHGNLVLERCATEPLERGWVSDGNIEKFDQVAEAVRRLVRKSGTKVKDVAMALPPSAVITKKVILPAGLNEKDLEVQVEAEANQYIPFPLEEVALDFCVIGPSAASSDNIDVMIAASRREKVEDRQGLAEAAGLNPIILDVESYAARLALSRLLDVLPNRASGLILALFEVGAFSTRMQVVRDGEVLYERDQAFGGAQLTQQLVRQYGYSLEEAEARKRSGDLPDTYAAEVLAPFIETMSNDISRSLQFFFTSTPHNRVDHVLLAGGTATLPGLVEAVATVTSSACAVIDPFEGMQVRPNAPEDRIRREAPAYLTACGLAMRRFLQ